MTLEKYWAYGIDFGHINSKFLESKGVPHVDELEFFNDWQLRSNNRSDPDLVMQFTKNCGACFDWFMEALTPEQLDNVQVRFWPAPKKFKGELNGLKTWIGTATFPEALWDNNPDDPLTKQAMEYIRGAQTAGDEGYAAADPRPGAKGKEQPKLYCADTLDKLADRLGFEGRLKQNLLDSVARYNDLCYSGRDEDFGKDASLCCPLTSLPITVC